VKLRIKNNSNTSQVIWIGMGSLSSFVLSMISAVILARYLDKTEYGTYRQVLYVYNTLLVLFSAGLPRVYGYFLPRYNLAEGKNIVWKVTKLLFVCGFTFSLCLFLLSNPIAFALNNSELELGLKYFSPIPMLLVPTLGLEGIFSAYRKTTYIAIYNVLSRLVMLIMIILPIILIEANYLYAIYGWIISSIFALVMAYFFMSIPFKGVDSKSSALSFKEIFRYSLPIMIASIAGIAITSSDQFYISRYFGIEVFAEFANGFIQLPFVGMVVGATSTVLMPLFSKMVYDRTDVNKLIELWQNALKKSAMIIYPLVIMFIYFAEETVTLLFSSTYSNSAIYFQIALVVNFFNIIMFAPLLLSLGKVKFYSNLHIIFAIFAWCGGYLIVLLTDSAVAIALFSITRSICIVLISLIYVSIIMKVSIGDLIPLKKLFVMIINGIVLLWLIGIVIMLVLPELSSVQKLIITCPLFLTIYMYTSKWLNLNYIILIKSIMK
jgi:O-antigen/teichoic acid export membrane protein